MKTFIVFFLSFVFFTIQRLHELDLRHFYVDSKICVKKTKEQKGDPVLNLLRESIFALFFAESIVTNEESASTHDALAFGQDNLSFE